VQLFERENGVVTGVRKIKKKIPASGYLKTRKRFRHLFESDLGREELQKLQAIADKNIEKYGLMSAIDK
jgi:pyruvate ferredoxin oxidoreductase beta subunit